MDATTIATTPVPGWETLFPWLRAGTTRQTAGNPERALAGRWRSVVGSWQVHGARSRVHAGVAPGVCRLGEGDGHVTRSSGVLLTVTLADCVPVFVVDPVARAVGLFHAGWRGTAAGVVESGVGTLIDAFGSDPGELVVHLGPAICEACYEVGPEVFSALGEMPPPGPAPIDLRGVIRKRAVSLGVPDGQVTTSDECTLCGDGRYYSHRRGDTGRHLGFIGILPRAGGLRGGRGD
ncbi:MAG: polyphenol oxidase family protein [Gemmatimonadetes bacterium]|nr:polyphenol oxidase family protein [Gemmatimonadota bacterium]